MRVVISLGRNALCPPGASPDAGVQRQTLQKAAASVAAIARRHDVVVTHGSEPLLGRLAFQAAAEGEPEGAAAAPSLDIMGAESEGMIGYLIEQELEKLLPGRDIATLLTQVEVDPSDPAFNDPCTPIGPLYREERARALARDRGWQIAPEADGFRRVVPSPVPRHILEMRTIALLVKLGVLVVCSGGGGIPVVRGEDGGLRGVEAVIDKDLSALVLATQLGADRLLLLTDVPAVYKDWSGPSRQPIVSASPRSLRELSFDATSMAPKVEAACRFAKQTGCVASIGALEDAPRILSEQAGTHIRPGAEPLKLA